MPARCRWRCAPTRWRPRPAASCTAHDAARAIAGAVVHDRPADRRSRARRTRSPSRAELFADLRAPDAAGLDALVRRGRRGRRRGRGRRGLQRRDRPALALRAGADERRPDGCAAARHRAAGHAGRSSFPRAPATTPASWRWPACPRRCCSCAATPAASATRPRSTPGPTRSRPVRAALGARAAGAGRRMIDWETPRPAVAARARALRPGAEPRRAAGPARARRARAAELERGSLRAAAGGARRRRQRASNAHRSTPSGAFADFRDAVAGWLDVPAESIMPAHGAQALIASIATAFVDSGTPVVVPRLTYGLYAQVSAAAGAAGDAGRAGRPGDRSRRGRRPRPARRAPASSGSAIPTTRPARSSTLASGRASSTSCRPGLPGGRRRGVHRLRRARAVAPIVVRDVLDGRPVIVIRSFSKIFGLAGLRLGYAICDPGGGAAARHRAGAVQRQPGRAGSRPGGGRRARVRRAAKSRGRRRPRGARRRAGRRRDREPPLADELRPCRAGRGRPRGLRRRCCERGFLVRGRHEFGLPGRLRVTVGPEPLMRRAAAQIAWAAGAVG